MVSQPQSSIKLCIVPCDGHLETTPTEVELTLLVVPEGSDTQYALLSVGFRTNTLPADGGAVTCDVEFIDDSDGDSITVITDDFDLEAATVLVNNEVFRGHQLMDSGDAINVVFTTDGTLDTAAEGAAFVVEYRVVRHSG